MARKIINIDKRKEIAKCYKDDLPLNLICQKFNICEATIDNVVNEAGIPRLRRQNSKYDCLEVIKFYETGLTCREIAKLIDGKHRTIASIVKEAGISRNTGIRPGTVSSKVKKCHTFDNSFIYFLDGLMISDGHLSSKGRSPTASYRQSCVNLEWLQNITEIFNGKNIETSLTTDNRKKRISYNLRTPVYEKLFKQYDRWYKNGVKIVPDGLNFSDIVFLKNWIYGDGTLVNNSTLRLCTDDFTEKEVDWLILSLNKNLDTKFKKIYMGLNKKGRPKFRPSLCMRDGLLNFYKNLGKPDIVCFEYKWRY